MLFIKISFKDSKVGWSFVHHDCRAVWLGAVRFRSVGERICLSRRYVVFKPRWILWQGGTLSDFAKWSAAVIDDSCLCGTVGGLSEKA